MFKEMEIYFNNYQGESKIRLNDWTMINDVKLFANSHIQALKSNPRNRLYLPYYDRLLELYKLLTKN